MPGADLHIHTYYSDSTASPEEVVQDALKANLQAIAITDHDIVEGIAPTIAAAKGTDLEVIPGIEVSSDMHGVDIHILGYFIDYNKGPLLEKVDLFLQGRVERMKTMIMNLKKVGIDNIEYEEVAALTKSRAVGRAHLATILLQKGHVTSMKVAFEKLIGQGCPGFAPKFHLTPFEAIDLIRQSGGIAAMAHPMLTQKDELIPRFTEAGMQGLEVNYPNCMDLVRNFYDRLARKNKLIATGGSDAHGAAKPYTYIGKATVEYSVVESMRELAGVNRSAA
jgi:predicted metal-dependent phosphoesterase TrpH